MDRRAFLISGALAVLAAPLAAEAQQAGKVWRIGYLAYSPRPQAGVSPAWDAFVEELSKRGYIEGQNLRFEWRYVPAGGAPQLAEPAADLVRLKVDVIVVPSSQPALAAKQATTTIPIVMAAVGDPIEAGLVRSLARPGGNITGLSVIGIELTRKRLEVLKEELPTASRIGVLVDASNSMHEPWWRATEEAAKTFHLQARRFDVREPNDFESAFGAMTKEGIQALVVFPEPMFYSQRKVLADLSAHRRLPAMHGHKGHVEAGDLISYGPDYRDL